MNSLPFLSRSPAGEFALCGNLGSDFFEFPVIDRTSFTGRIVTGVAGVVNPAAFYIGHIHHPSLRMNNCPFQMKDSIFTFCLQLLNFKRHIPCGQKRRVFLTAGCRGKKNGQ